jgi:thiol-disulfide isomerase/thioredoxin
MLSKILAYLGGVLVILSSRLLPTQVFAAIKRSLGAGKRLRHLTGAATGVAILGGVAALAMGLDTSALAQVSTAATAGIEEKIVDRLSPERTPVKNSGRFMTIAAHTSPPASLPVEGTLPPLTGAVEWLNSPPLSANELRGKVVVVNFWTYSCINCLRTLPYLKTWSKKYRDQGLVVIGVHAPEFAFERGIGNVKRAAHDLGIDYPVAIDNNYALWRAFGNQYWPAFYVVDAQGHIRYHQFGEGKYDKSEEVIQQLLRDAGHSKLPTATESAQASGTQVASDERDLLSGETYIGYKQADGFVSPEKVLPDGIRTYTSPADISLNTWSLEGPWKIGAERAQLAGASGRIVYRFHARDLHLVLGPGSDGKPVRFRVTIDGAAPGSSHGTDVAADGSGMIDGERLYQLVRQTGPIRDRTFAIEFLDSGASAYAFTFG